MVHASGLLLFVKEILLSGRVQLKWAWLWAECIPTVDKHAASGWAKLHCQLPADVMVNLCHSLVYSHLTYALLAWGREILVVAFFK